MQPGFQSIAALGPRPNSDARPSQACNLDSRALGLKLGRAPSDARPYQACNLVSAGPRPNSDARPYQACDLVSAADRGTPLQTSVNESKSPRPRIAATSYQLAPAAAGEHSRALASMGNNFCTDSGRFNNCADFASGFRTIWLRSGPGREGKGEREGQNCCPHCSDSFGSRTQQFEDSRAGGVPCLTWVELLRGVGSVGVACKPWRLAHFEARHGSNRWRKIGVLKSPRLRLCR